MTFKPSTLTHRLPSHYAKRPDRLPAVWYVIVCNINCEKRAELGLRQRGFLTYLPVLTKTAIRGRRKAETVVERPLFARYLFVGSTAHEMPFYHLRSTNGVESILRDGEGLPLSIPPAVVEEIMRREQMGEFDHTRQPKTLEEVGLVAGQDMQIERGAFEGLVVKIRKLLPGKNAEVLIRMLGGEQAVRMPLAELRPVA